MQAKSLSVELHKRLPTIKKLFLTTETFYLVSFLILRCNGCNETTAG